MYLSVCCCNNPLPQKTWSWPKSTQVTETGSATLTKNQWNSHNIEIISVVRCNYKSCRIPERLKWWEMMVQSLKIIVQKRCWQLPFGCWSFLARMLRQYYFSSADPFLVTFLHNLSISKIHRHRCFWCKKWLHYNTSKYKRPNQWYNSRFNQDVNERIIGFAIYDSIS